MIGKARNLSKINQDILIAYLHFLHMTEHLTRPHRWDWAYRNILAHWVGSQPRAHWVH